MDMFLLKRSRKTDVFIFYLNSPVIIFFFFLTLVLKSSILIDFCIVCIVGFVSCFCFSSNRHRWISVYGDAQMTKTIGTPMSLSSLYGNEVCIPQNEAYVVVKSNGSPFTCNFQLFVRPSTSSEFESTSWIDDLIRTIGLTGGQVR